MSSVATGFGPVGSALPLLPRTAVTKFEIMFFRRAPKDEGGGVGRAGAGVGAAGAGAAVAAAAAAAEAGASVKPYTQQQTGHSRGM
jgi:hypothetical protein